MEIPWISMVGAVAGMSTTGAFLPQVIRAWRTRSTHDISDAVSLILAGTVVGLKLRYG